MATPQLTSTQPTQRDIELPHKNMSCAVSNVQPFLGVPELYAQLSLRGFRLAVVTGAMASAAEIALTRSGLRPYFEEVVASDDVPAPKPDPAGILMACRLLGVKPERVAYVGDSDVDMQAAKAAGAYAIHATWGSTAISIHPAISARCSVTKRAPLGERESSGHRRPFKLLDQLLRCVVTLEPAQNHELGAGTHSGSSHPVHRMVPAIDACSQTPARPPRHPTNVARRES